jgi:2-amino-4-hydroxy-6-hydroxymethyldihydropteridine diphosphokinase
MSRSVYIGFGSNLGDRKLIFHETLRALRNLPKTLVTGKSRLYETDPVGLSDQGPKFLNAVIALETDLSPRELIDRMRSIEAALGKSASHRSDQSRPIDLDLLLYGEEHFLDDTVEIPHPRMHNRAFVLLPLAELAPKVFVPTFRCTVEDLVRKLSDREIAGVQILDSEND